MEGPRLVLDILGAKRFLTLEVAAVSFEVAHLQHYIHQIFYSFHWVKAQARPCPSNLKMTWLWTIRPREETRIMSFLHCDASRSLCITSRTSRGICVKSSAEHKLDLLSASSGFYIGVSKEGFSPYGSYHVNIDGICASDPGKDAVF